VLIRQGGVVLHIAGLLRSRKIACVTDTLLPAMLHVYPLLSPPQFFDELQLGMKHPNIKVNFVLADAHVSVGLRVVALHSQSTRRRCRTGRLVPTDDY
jgi:hypothetical protein